MIKILFLTLLMVSSVGAEPLDRIIAVVNDEVLLESELTDLEVTVRHQLRQRNSAIPPADALRKQVLERLIIRRVQIQLAVKVGIRVDDDVLNIGLRQIADNNKMTLREFSRVLQDDGFDFADFRDSIREEMIISRLRKTLVEDKIIVSEREVDNFIATQQAQNGTEVAYNLRHILISVPESALPEEVKSARENMTRIRALLKDGFDFSEIATGYSDGQNALEGGDLGWRKQGELPSLFAQVVPQLAVSSISDVFRSGSGFHLVKLVDKRNEQVHLVKQTLASHILIKTNELMTDEDAEKGLNSFRKRILNGEDFAELARAHSDDTGSAMKGGSLGWNSPGKMVPEFEEKTDALAPGDVSTVFKSRFGWHLIKLYERREKNMSEEFKRSNVRGQIRQRKIAENIESWLRQLYDQAYIEYRIN